MNPRLWFVLWALLLCAAPVSARETVRVEPARKKIELTGFTRSAAVMTLAPEVSGRVASVHYDVGDAVGEIPFVEIDPTFIDFQIQAIREALKQVEAAKEKNESSVAFNKKELARYQRLLRADGATEVQRDQAQENLNQARLDAARLAAETAELEVKLAEQLERKARHQLFAPEGWVLIDRRVEPGELVDAGTPVGRAADYRTLTVPLAVSGAELDAIREMPEVFEARLEGEPVETRLGWVNPEFDERTRKLAVELLLENYDGPRRGGLRFSLPLQVPAEGVWIAKSAVVNRHENPRVTLKTGGETVNIMVLGESDGHFIVAKDPRLGVGTELMVP
ncbi:MAG: efflux RND transporter periplasmic adaptor subunit [Desulfococcaceae bacterium]